MSKPKPNKAGGQPTPASPLKPCKACGGKRPACVFSADETYVDCMQRPPTDPNAGKFPRRVYLDPSSGQPLPPGSTPDPTPPAPAKPGKASKQPAEQTPASPPKVRILADIVEKRIDWLWRGRIQLGAVNIIDGHPGLGKSGVAFDVAARLTTGRPMPLCADPPHPPASVLVLDAENTAADVIRPRLRVTGADLRRIILPPEDELLYLPGCADWIEQVVVAHGVKLVVIDPVMSFLDGRIEMNNDQSVRQALGPLKGVCERTGAAVLMVRHLNKKDGQSALLRGAGAMAFTGVSRSALIVGVDPDDPDTRILAGSKVNNTKMSASITYTVGEADAGGDIGMMPVIVWGDVRADLSADDLTSHKPDTLGTRGSVDAAAAFLRRELSPAPVLAEVMEQRAHDEDIKPRTLARAKAKLKVVSKPGSFQGKVVWSLPTPPRECQPSGRGGSWQPLGETLVFPEAANPHLAGTANPPDRPADAPPGPDDLEFGEPGRGAA